MFFCEMSASDNMYPVKLPARLVICVLSISIGLLSPILPGEMARAASQQTNRRAYEVTSGQCCGSQSRPAPSSSAMNSNCCSGQTCCVVLYVASTTHLADPFLTGERISAMEQHALARTQRPPVPPPRVEFS
jgi:hypothetical protein